MFPERDFAFRNPQNGPTVWHYKTAIPTNVKQQTPNLNDLHWSAQGKVDTGHEPDRIHFLRQIRFLFSISTWKLVTTALNGDDGP